MPLLLFGSGMDTIVSTRAIEEFALRLKVGTHVMFPQSRHEILQETDEIRQRFGPRSTPTSGSTPPRPEAGRALSS